MHVLDELFEKGIGIIRRNLFILLNNKERNAQYKEQLLKDLAGKTLYKRTIKGIKADGPIRISSLLDDYELDLQMDKAFQAVNPRVAFTIVTKESGHLMYHVFFEKETAIKDTGVHLDNLINAYFTREFGKTISEAVCIKCPFCIMPKEDAFVLNVTVNALPLTHSFDSREAALFTLMELLLREEEWNKA